MRQFIYGKNVVSERLNNDKEILELFVLDNKHQDIVKKAKSKRIKVTFLNKNKMDKLTNGNHQGLVAEIFAYKFYQLEDIISDKEYPVILMLDQVEDPHNFGAIIRTAVAAGIDGIIILNRRSVGITPTVVKVAAGAMESIKIVEVNNLKRTIDELKDLGYWIVGSDLKDAVNYTDIDYKMKTVLVMGSEGKGMSRLVRESCDFIAKIPILGAVESLNVSVASAVFMYEILKQHQS